MEELLATFCDVDDFCKAYPEWKSSTYWFYGFKLHLIINDRDEILSVSLTSGNIDDRNRNVISRLTKQIYGKLFADRGYLSQKLFERLLNENITLITNLKKNVKNTYFLFLINSYLEKGLLLSLLMIFWKISAKLNIQDIVLLIIIFSVLPNFLSNSH